VARLLRGNRFPSRQARRRLNKWSLGPQAVAQPISTVTVTGWSLLVALAQAAEVTLVRSRGYVDLMLTSTTSAFGGFTGALGLAIVTAEAGAVGVTAIPSPLTDADWDGWLWHHFFSCLSVTATIADGANAQSVYQHFEIDSKAMRKWTDQQVIVGILETGAEVGTAVMQMNADVRHLVKLP